MKRTIEGYYITARLKNNSDIQYYAAYDTLEGDFWFQRRRGSAHLFKTRYGAEGILSKLKTAMEHNKYYFQIVRIETSIEVVEYDW